MVKSKLVSSLDLLTLSKSRIDLILKDLINNLINLLNYDYTDNLSEFLSLCNHIKANQCNDVSTFIAENILDYNINYNQLGNNNTATIEFIFKSNFPIKSLKINDLNL